MNDLQRLLRLRGITCHDIAGATGLGYYLVQKTIRKAPYKTSAGRILIRRSRRVRQKVADYLGLTYDQTWGAQSTLVLRRLIRAEVAKRKQRFEAELKAKYLPDDNRVSDETVARNG